MRKTTSFLIISILFLLAGTTMTTHADDTFDFSDLNIVILNQDPDPAVQGDYLELRWKVQKVGNEEMKDITFHLNVEYPFSFDEGTSPEKKIGDWAGFSEDDEYYTLYYKIRVDDNALEDTYEVELIVTDDMTKTKKTHDFDIRVGERTSPEFVLGTLETTPLKLVSDSEENQLDVTLENIGDEAAENVRVELDLPEGFKATYGYSDRAVLGTVDAGGGKTATFYMDIEKQIVEGSYEGMLKISFKEADDDDNVYKSLTLPIDIPINGKPMFEITDVRTVPESLHENDDAKLIVNVKNIGTKEAESVSIRALKETSQPFDFEEKSDFVGKLEPGESGDAVLKFSVDKGAAVKTYLLDTEIRGVYNEDVITDSKVVQIKVENNLDDSMFEGSVLVGVGIVAAFIIAGILVFFLFLRN